MSDARAHYVCRSRGTRGGTRPSRRISSDAAFNALLGVPSSRPLFARGAFREPGQVTTARQRRSIRYVNNAGDGRDSRGVGPRVRPYCERARESAPCRQTNGVFFARAADQ